jgi:tungstate transport system ATP-binding protein
MLERLKPSGIDEESVRPVGGTGIHVARNGRVLLDVDEVSFSGARLTAIVGPNGAGKSLLLKVLAGVIRPDRGEVRWGTGSPSPRGYRRLSLLLQAPVVLRRSVLANVEFALSAAGFGRDAIVRRSREALEKAGLSGLSATAARLLSGGEKQRLALARALAIEPEVLFLDEPVANLDPASVITIEAMIRAERARGTTVVLVTHDLAQAHRLADDVMFMLRGRIVERGDAAAFLNAPRSAQARAFVAGEIVL